MSVKVDVMYDDGMAIRSKGVTVDRIQDYCPLCHRSITADHITGWLNFEELQLVLRCPDDRCNKLFIGYYRRSSMQEQVGRDVEFVFIGRSAPGGIIKRDFSEEINKISEKFEKIYNEAKAAEERGLEEICGAGYRRALEFLIKDYLIKQKADKGKVIKETGLGKSIDGYIEDERIKDCAKRAAWIGNELTHYYRRWKDKDLDDLKNLLELTVHWIEMESLSKKYKKEMPEKKTKGKK